MAQKIEARFIIQIAGKPVENVEKALNLVLEKLKNEKEKFKLMEHDIAEPEFDEKSTLYSGFIEVLIKFSEVKEMLSFVVDYTPSSIVIEEPEKITIDNDEMTGILNDMSHIILSMHSQIRKLNAHIHFMNKQNPTANKTDESSKKSQTKETKRK